MTAWLKVTPARISHSLSQSMKRVSGGLVLALTSLLMGCGPSLPGEAGAPGDLARSSASLVEQCPDIPLAAGSPSMLPICDTYSYCGDGLCRAGETQYNCPDDCGYPSYCGDGVCSTAVGESDLNCAADCYCGDNLCNGSETVNTCPRDCGCPNLCGNGVCNNNESTGTCWTDCGTLCGDYVCNGGENASNCAQDCNYCGDGICRSPETRYNCPDDCGTIYCMTGSGPGNSMLPACPMEPLR